MQHQHQNISKQNKSKNNTYDNKMQIKINTQYFLCSILLCVINNNAIDAFITSNLRYNRVKSNFINFSPKETNIRKFQLNENKNGLNNYITDINNQEANSNSNKNNLLSNRRSVISKIISSSTIISSSSLFNIQASYGIEQQPQQPPIDLLLESRTTPLSEKELVQGLLETRVNENLLSPPTYGLEIPDVFYPE